MVLECITLKLNCRNHEGPTVLIIKDKEGCIYGGYASQPWERHAEFYGDMKCYLFQLNPKASIYRPTGANHNLQWVTIYLFLTFADGFTCFNISVVGVVVFVWGEGVGGGVT